MQSEMEVVLRCENYVQADALTVVDLACEQALLFGREKDESRENARASGDSKPRRYYYHRPAQQGESWQSY